MNIELMEVGIQLNSDKDVKELWDAVRSGEIKLGSGDLTHAYGCVSYNDEGDPDEYHISILTDDASRSFENVGYAVITGESATSYEDARSAAWERVTTVVNEDIRDYYGDWEHYTKDGDKFVCTLYISIDS